MRMRGESPAARDRVVVEDAQRPESHVVRVVIAVETEQPVGRQPVAFYMKPVFCLDDLHNPSSYGFYLGRNYRRGFSNARSIENAPPPLINSAIAMAIASRWYSNPSPACFPIQICRNQFLKHFSLHCPRFHIFVNRNIVSQLTILPKKNRPPGRPGPGRRIIHPTACPANRRASSAPRASAGASPRWRSRLPRPLSLPGTSPRRQSTRPG